jgi:cytochrome d ubiquinol oxidase subunit I
MGLALIIVVLKAMALRKNDEKYNDAARFWAKIFAINFVMGVVTGIPMEFQFGTNWGRFSNYAGGVIGLTLAMEGLFAFFAESAFLGLFLFGEKKLGPKGHLIAAFMVFLGSWLSGYFIIATNAFMQHPVGYQMTSNGVLQLHNFWVFVLNPWAIWEYAHNMCASVVTATFVVTAIGAFWSLMEWYKEHAKLFLRVGISMGLLFSLLQLFPTGDQNGKMVARYQQTALAGMEGKFQSSAPADLVIIGQPDVSRRTLENPIAVPAILSFLAYGSFGAEVKGLDAFPQDQWPDNVELLYYSYHIMVGLGTILIAIMLLSYFLMIRGQLNTFRPMLWILMLAFPFPYIATAAGWMTAELGRQPWVVWQLFRTNAATSPYVSGGNVSFTVLGFMGLYALLSFLFLFLVGRVVASGPETTPAAVKQEA